MKRLLQLFRAPGFIRPFIHESVQTGEVVSLRTSPRYTILSIPGREFYFDRVTGKLDGTGAMALGDETAINGLRADRIRRTKPSTD